MNRLDRIIRKARELGFDNETIGNIALGMIVVISFVSALVVYL